MLPNIFKFGYNKRESINIHSHGDLHPNVDSYPSAAGYNVGDYIGSKVGSAIEDYIKRPPKSNSGYKGSPGVNNNHYHYSIPSFDNLNSQE
jgi:hypothetical protein